MQHLLCLLLLLPVSAFAQAGKNYQPRVAMTNSLAGGLVTVTVTDTFNRTDANPMSTAMSDGIGTWVSGPGALGDARIISNTLGVTSSARGANVSSPAFGANQIATVTFATGSTGYGPMVRCQSDGDASGYLAYMGSSTIITIYRVTDTGTIASTAIGGGITVTAFVAGDTLGIGIEGTTITAYTNGVSTGTTRTDATYATGRPGVYFGSATSTIDAFTATEE